MTDWVWKALCQYTEGCWCHLAKVQHRWLKQHIGAMKEYDLKYLCSRLGLTVVILGKSFAPRSVSFQIYEAAKAFPTYLTMLPPPLPPANLCIHRI